MIGLGRLLAQLSQRHRTNALVLAVALLMSVPSVAWAQQNWPGQADWDATVAAARKEGRVVVSGPTGNAWREPLTSFEREYGIRVEYTAANGADFWPRYDRERKLGQSLWDLRISPPDLNSYRFLQMGDRIADLRSMLVLPDVVSDAAWHGGFDSIFSDNTKRYFVGFGLIGGPIAWVNRDIVPESELTSMLQLQEPRFKGRITTQDWRGGSASNNFALLLADPKYGATYIRRLVQDNEIVVLSNTRQQIDWLVRGSHPVAISAEPSILLNMQESGIGLNVKRLDGPLKYSSSFGGLIAFQNAPNPNAAKVYANWLLTQQAQARIAKAAKFNSRRTDVEIAEPQNAVELDKLTDYVNTQSEAMLPNYEKWQQFSKDLKR